MIVFFGVMAFKFWVEEALRVKIVAVDFATFEDEFGLFVGGGEHLVCPAGAQAGVREFGSVASGVTAEPGKVFVIFGREGAEGEVGGAFDEVVGGAGGADDDLDEGLVPEGADTAPADGHAVEVAGRKVAGAE